MYHDSPGRLFGEHLMLLSVGFPPGQVFLPRDEFPGLQGWLPEFESVSGKGPGASTVTVFILALHLPAVQALADRKSTRLNSSHSGQSRMPSSA